jgi:predicted PurR-regulated permease PerM
MTADSGSRTAVALIAVLAIFVAAYLASSVLAPLALSLFIIALAWPLQAHLQSRMPKLAALAIVMLAIIAVFVAFASLIVWGFGRVGQSFVNDAARFQLLYEQAKAWIEAHGIALAGVWAEHFNVRWLVRAVQEITGRVSTTMTFWLVGLLYVMLGLLEVDDFARKLRAMANDEAARVLLDGSAIAAAKLRKYMVVRTLMSAVTGLLVWAFASLAGLQARGRMGRHRLCPQLYPLHRPVHRHRIPDPVRAHAVRLVAGRPGGSSLAAISSRAVCGTALALSPTVVLLAVFLWTFLWGPFGAFIGVPITIVLLTFCAQHPSSRWLAELLGDAR